MLDGRGELVVGGTPITVAAGDSVLMPAGVPHAVSATGRFKTLLIMIRG